MENNSKEKYLVMDNVRNIYYGIPYFKVWSLLIALLLPPRKRDLRPFKQENKRLLLHLSLFPLS